MNEHQFTTLRNYAEELASLARQQLAEQKRTNELLAQQAKERRKQEIAEREGVEPFDVAVINGDDGVVTAAVRKRGKKANE